MASTIEKTVPLAKYQPTEFKSEKYEELMSIAAIEEMDERARAYDELVKQIADDTRKRFVSCFYEKKIRQVDMQLYTTAGASMISKVLSGEKSVPVMSMGNFCYNLFHMSCNELVMDSPCTIIVPNEFNALINMFESEYSYEWKDAVRTLIQRFQPMTRNKNERDPEPVSLISERLLEIEKEEGLNLSTVTLQNEWAQGLAIKLNSKTSVYKESLSSVYITRIIGYTLRFRRPIDYFIVRDYSRYAELYYRNKDKLLPIKSTLYKKLFSVYLRLSTENRAHMMAEIFMMQYRRS